jgi:hypothetical protein
MSARTLGERLQEFTKEQVVWLVERLAEEHGEGSVRKWIAELEEVWSAPGEHRQSFLQLVDGALARVRGLQATFEANGGRAHLFAQGQELASALEGLLDAKVRALAERDHPRLALLLLCDLAQALCVHTDDQCKNYGEAEAFLSTMESLAFQWVDAALASSRHAQAIDDRGLLSAVIAAFDETPWAEHQVYGWPNSDEWMAATRAHARLRALGPAARRAASTGDAATTTTTSSITAALVVPAASSAVGVHLLGTDADSDIDPDSESDNEVERVGEPAVTVLSPGSVAGGNPSPASTRLRITRIHSLLKKSPRRPTATSTRARRLCVESDDNQDHEHSDGGESVGAAHLQREEVREKEEEEEKSVPDSMANNDSLLQHFATAAPGANARAVRRRVMMVVDSDSETEEQQAAEEQAQHDSSQSPSPQSKRARVHE